ncbi:MAG: VIT1/CCC1 transporter family protein [Simkaniaceae bacterium]
MKKDAKHFEGTDVKKHLLRARQKGACASGEMHGTESSGFLSAFCDSGRELAVILLFLSLLPSSSSTLFIISIPLILWKTGRSAQLGYFRLERLHRLIEEERYEILHHRAQEKEELLEMYRAKGLSGSLLEETVEVLMADDNRLLKVMLEEELGLTLESFEHPLRQGFGAFLGSSLSCLVLLIAARFHALLPLSLTLSACFTFLLAKKNQNNLIRQVSWTLSLALIGYFTLTFLIEILQ